MKAKEITPERLLEIREAELKEVERRQQCFVTRGDYNGARLLEHTVSQHRQAVIILRAELHRNR